MLDNQTIDYNIDKSNPTPFYYQIQKKITEAIESNLWKPGELLPSERELSYNFQVSRITTRKALERLMVDGYIRKIKGRGAVISKPRIQEQLFNKLIGTYQDLKEKGFDITNKIMDFKIIKGI
ncbi:MAG: GntR family transcriptional regulator [Actinobacteria bacterium]|nr:GntR family transcriptional regulator [Actinomycetota bacterium]